MFIPIWDICSHSILQGAALERVQLGDPQALRTQYLNAIRRLLQALSTRSPVVMVLEDLHWADPSSTGLLVELLPFGIFYSNFILPGHPS